MKLSKNWKRHIWQAFDLIFNAVVLGLVLGVAWDSINELPFFPFISFDWGSYKSFIIVLAAMYCAYLCTRDIIKGVKKFHNGRNN